MKTVTMLIGGVKVTREVNADTFHPQGWMAMNGGRAAVKASDADVLCRAIGTEGTGTALHKAAAGRMTVYPSNVDSAIIRLTDINAAEMRALFNF